MSESVRDILSALGYSLKDFGKYYRTKPLYRDSNNSTSLSINKETGFWSDFSTNKMGNIKELVALTLGLKTIDNAQKWLDTHNFSIESVEFQKPKIKSQKVYDIKNINLLPDYSYWNKRGISDETLKYFESGLCMEGKQKGRYVFPIFNNKHQLIGTAGRTVYSNNDVKWKLLGDKNHWGYPLFLNLNNIKSKNEIILVESIGDCLSLWESGIKNTMVLFGINLGPKRLSILLKLKLEKIIVALNKDGEENNCIGEIASQKIQKSLKRYFDESQIIIKHPTKNDFGDMNKEEIINWYASKN